MFQLSSRCVQKYTCWIQGDIFWENLRQHVIFFTGNHLLKEKKKKKIADVNSRSLMDIRDFNMNSMYTVLFKENN